MFILHARPIVRLHARRPYAILSKAMSQGSRRHTFSLPPPTFVAMQVLEQ
jgi:hypothetical protein